MDLDQIRAGLLTLHALYQKRLAQIEEAIRTLAALDSVDPAPVTEQVTQATATKRKRKGMSRDARAAVSARMKKYWADRRKKKG